ncbi:MAG: thiamine-monophosphate kinase [Gammaproteobacteria bacterium]|jgi:thiamine-monophosphate kinase|nr:thiamine-monophosphate kinase [Gammaproteobacteria bacterium]
MNAEIPALGEFELIDRFFLRPAGRGAPSGVILGIGDDAAVLALPPDTELVAAVDTIVAGRHFPEGSDARSIGHRALAVNLSDLAAMGATPAWATLALTLPSVDAAWLERFSAGLLDLADANGVALVGGDTTRGPLTVSVQILGHVPRGTALRRSGAGAGDLLVVTGTLGDAGAGLNFATAPPMADNHVAVLELIQRFEYPAPRVRFGVAARGIATAAMDLSDGLVADLPKLAKASGLAAQVAVDRLPLSEAMRAAVPAAQARDWALAAGDDYELLLAVPAQRLAELEAAASRLNLSLAVVGDLRSGSGVTWSLNGREFVPGVRGWDHFAQASTQITV